MQRKGGGTLISLIPNSYSLSCIHIHPKITCDVLCVDTGGLKIMQLQIRTSNRKIGLSHELEELKASEEPFENLFAIVESVFRFLTVIFLMSRFTELLLVEQ